MQQWFSTPTTDFEGKYEAVKQIFDDLGVRKVTDDEVLRYVNKALADLDRVHAGEEKKKALHDLAVKLINREK